MKYRLNRHIVFPGRKLERPLPATLLWAEEQGDDPAADIPFGTLHLKVPDWKRLFV